MPVYSYEQERDGENRVRLVAVALSDGERAYVGPWCGDMATARRTLLKSAARAAGAKWGVPPHAAYRAILVALDMANWLAISLDARDAANAAGSAP